MVPRWISSRPNLSARAKRMQRAYAGRRIGSRTDSYWEGCKKSASQMLRGGNDANSKLECVRPSAVTLAVGPTHAVCRGGRSTRARRAASPVLLRFAIEITVWLAAVTLAGAVLLVLYSNLRSSAEVDPRALGADSGFAMTRGSFEVAVATSGLIQPHIRDLAVVCKMDLFDTNGTLRVPLKHMFIAPSYRRTMA
jgi:hypothetical protein